MLGDSGLIRDAYEAALPRMVVGVALIWQFTILIQVLAYLPDYRQPAVPVAAWAGMLVAAAWLLPRARAGRLRGLDAAVAIGVAVVVVALVGWQRRVHTAGAIDWSVAGTAWLLALVALCRPAWEWAIGAAAVFTAHAIFAFPVLGLAALGQARLAATGYTVVVVLAGFAALRPSIRAHARIAARRAALASRAAAERAAAAAIYEDRRGRLAALEAEALPLLRGIADGTLDPATSEVQARCARHAAALRHALAGQPQQASGLLADLEPALGAARARGLPVEVQAVGDPGRPGRDVARATLAAVDAVIRALPAQPVTLTVLASAGEAELYLIFGRAPEGMPNLAGLAATVPADAQWRVTVDSEEAGPGCLEIRWRTRSGAGVLA